MSRARYTVEISQGEFSGVRSLLYRNYRILVTSIFLMGAPAIVVADPHERINFDLMYELGVSRFALAEQVLRNSADYMAENPEISSLQGHFALKGILNKSEQFRSILAINGDGMLLFDSYNMFPFLGAKDLSDRQYWRVATGSAAKEMVIGKPVVGRQSGQVFVPLAMAVPNASGLGQSVAVLTVPPESLLPRADLCLYCGFTVVARDTVIASSRPLSVVNKALLNELDFKGHYGAVTVNLRGMEVTIFWRRATEYGVIFIYYEAKPGGE